MHIYSIESFTDRLHNNVTNDIRLPLIIDNLIHILNGYSKMFAKSR